MNMIKKTLAVSALILSLNASVFAGQLSLGGQFNAWSSNYVQPFSGWEVVVPLTLSFNAGGGLGFYGQTEYMNGGYTDSITGSANTVYLSNLSDSVVGAELNFKSFNVPSVLNVGFNIPTGDTGWEQKQLLSNVPTEFVPSRYRGRGFGINAMYGFSFPAGSAQIGAAAGYSYAGNYNPNFGSTASPVDLKLGDTIFLAFNHVQPFSENQSQIIRLSGLVSLTSQQDGQNILLLGPNLNASYSWKNPAALSFDLGVQYFLPGQRQIGGVLAAEPHNFYGARFYLTPSYAFGDFTLTAQGKYILPNGYAQTDAFYNDGGYLVGVEPSYLLKLDDASGLKLSAGVDAIVSQNAGLDANGARTNVNYTYWTFGTSYEVKL